MFDGFQNYSIGGVRGVGASKIQRDEILRHQPREADPRLGISFHVGLPVEIHGHLRHRVSQDYSSDGADGHACHFDRVADLEFMDRLEQRAHVKAALEEGESAEELRNDKYEYNGKDEKHAQFAFNRIFHVVNVLSMVLFPRE